MATRMKRVNNSDSVDVENCDVEFNRICATNANIGGFAGNGYGKLNDCYSKGVSVEANHTVGGFIGESSCDIKNCYALQNNNYSAVNNSSRYGVYIEFTKEGKLDISSKQQPKKLD